MESPIVNRVQQSTLEVIDLAALSPNGPRTGIDIAQWLDQGLVLREKDFRAQVQAHPWENYEGHFVAVHCTTAAILPAWAQLLVSIMAAPYAKRVIAGSLDTLEEVLFADALQNLDLTPYTGRPVIIKGCSDKEVPESAYVDLLARLQKVAKKISYGEACSAVPLWSAPK
jgi:hypothetical protein